MRFCLCLLALALSLVYAADSLRSTTLRGRLSVRAGKPPALETADHKLVALDGDDSTLKILHDRRVNGFEVEARGHFTAPGQFQIDPIHSRSLLVRQDGRLKMYQ